MKTLILIAIASSFVLFILWRNRKNIEESFKHGETGFSARKLIAFQLMAAILAGDSVYIYLLFNNSQFAQKYFGEWENTHLLYVMFVLGFLSVPEIVKLVSAIRGNKIDKNEN